MKSAVPLLLVAGVLSAVPVGPDARLYAQENSAAGPAQITPVNSVSAGTRFIIALQTNLDTKAARNGDRFHARTLEPLVTSNGAVLSPGMEVRGHIDKVEAARTAGRARLWLTFDEIKTPLGWEPLIADVVDVPGVHSVKVDYDREGEIEARTSNRQQEAEAAAAGAFVGAAGGVAAHNGKDAAMGAAAGAATAFMATSGLGQDLTLSKDTKLEVILDRPLYVSRY
jgi:hypothetical protein